MSKCGIFVASAVINGSSDEPFCILVVNISSKLMHTHKHMCFNYYLCPTGEYSTEKKRKSAKRRRVTIWKKFLQWRRHLIMSPYGKETASTSRTTRQTVELPRQKNELKLKPKTKINLTRTGDICFRVCYNDFKDYYMDRSESFENTYDSHL